ncbi:HlyD family type I secretion periplasmic adaptor subunit [Thioclava sp. DLFJ4-1]|uniref:HlyD family type I secretion periplasmic adaptor subunit n=1 Tax=Thioclava sp. DLFJ4-1 TaxID=1915313 RepID=UPI00099652B4|nr:HlyD family type I secretion periplasmic adaptor subunit [Thioclava sp. DLFJ4-1]
MSDACIHSGQGGTCCTPSQHGVPISFGLAAIVALFIGSALWLTVTRLAGSIQASGRIEVDSSRHVIEHPTGGTIEQIYVKSGDHVTRGQVLMRLASDDIRTELAIVEASDFALQAQRARLQAERDGANTVPYPRQLLEAAKLRADVTDLVEGQNSLFEARKQSFAQQRAEMARQLQQIRAQRDGLDAQVTALEREERLIEKELALRERLKDRGLATSAQILALTREQVSLERQLGALSAQKTQLTVQSGGVVLTASRLQWQRREEIESQLESSNARAIELSARTTHLRRELARRTLRAPVSGTVHDVRLRGSHAVLRPAEMAMAIVETGRPLIVNAQVDPTNIDGLEAGQTAILRFPGLSRRISSDVTGTITRISPDTLTDPATGVSYYEARITFDMDELDAEERRLLVPGMPAEVFLQTAPVSPIRYLLSPFLDFFALGGAAG